MGQDCVIYCRASKDKTGAGLSVQGQETDCRAFADEHGLTVREVFADNDISASGKKRRPAYRDMLGYLAAHPGTVVVCWHTDRLHRHLAELEEYITLAEAHSVITRAVRAGDLDLATPTGRMIARQLGVYARFELEHMSERRSAGKARAASAGRWKGGRRPFGYKADGITVKPAEAQAIGQAAEDVLAGVSLHAIARRWNADGIRTATGKTWHVPEVRRVLLRPRNAGLMEHRGQVVGRAEWPAIVPEDTWRAVVGVLTDSVRTTTTGPERVHLLSGIARCGVCGRGLVVSRISGKTRRPRPVYRCRPVDGQSVMTGHVNRDAGQLEHYITELALERLSRADLADSTTPPRSANGNAAELHAKMTSARQRLDHAAVMYAAGTIDAPQLTIITGKLNAEMELLGRQLADLARRDALAEFTGRDPREVWDGLDLGRRRAVLQALMTITVNPAPKGRPRGWQAGQPYFDEDSIAVEWHR
jgi:DNA invertase Pin-like site-specific DNA recombinase